MTKRKRYLLCGHGESLPMAEDGTNLAFFGAGGAGCGSVRRGGLSSAVRQRGAFRFRVGVVL